MQTSHICQEIDTEAMQAQQVLRTLLHAVAAQFNIEPAADVDIFANPLDEQQSAFNWQENTPAAIPDAATAARACRGRYAKHFYDGLRGLLREDPTLQKLLAENPQAVLQFADHLEDLAKDLRQAAEAPVESHMEHVAKVHHLIRLTRGAAQIELGQTDHGLEIPVARDLQKDDWHSAFNKHVNAAGSTTAAGNPPEVLDDADLPSGVVPLRRASNQTTPKKPPNAQPHSPPAKFG